MKYINIHTHQQKLISNTINIYNLIINHHNNSVDNEFVSIGIHPWFLNDYEQKIKLFQQIIKQKKILAIGECGLDYRKEILAKYSKKLQQKVFLEQVRSAEKMQKPIIIHCVKCFDELIKLKNERNNSIKWIIHGFHKNEQIAKQLINEGFYLSFGHHIFNSNKNSLALKTVTLDKIFFETDEQTQYNIKDIYQKASKILQIDTKILIEKIYSNYINVFY